MSKFISCILIVISSANMCFALDLELSETIKNAREAKISQIPQKTKSEKDIKPVSSGNIMQKGEQSACEKLNPKEILKQDINSKNK